MGGMLHFRELRGFDDDHLRRGARINDYDGLREHVDSELASSLALSTVEGNEYPRYEYLCGLYYGHDDEPLTGDPYFIDNVYPNDYERIFAGISNYTERFAVLCARSFPRLNELLDGVERPPYVVVAADGEAEMHEMDMPDLPNFEEMATKIADGAFDDEE